jgi:hypothetical protein
MAQPQLPPLQFGPVLTSVNQFTDYWRKTFTLIQQLLTYKQVTVSLNFPNTASGAVSELPATVPDAAPGDFVSVAPVDAGVIVAGTSIQGRVSAANTVTVQFVNLSGAPVDPPAGNFNVRVWRQ